jgi:hypothetical protein
MRYANQKFSGFSFDKYAPVPYTYDIMSYLNFALEEAEN